MGRDWFETETEYQNRLAEERNHYLRRITDVAESTARRERDKEAAEDIGFIMGIIFGLIKFIISNLIKLGFFISKVLWNLIKDAYNTSAKLAEGRRNITFSILIIPGWSAVPLHYISNFTTNFVIDTVLFITPYCIFTIVPFILIRTEIKKGKQYDFFKSWLQLVLFHTINWVCMSAVLVSLDIK